MWDLDRLAARMPQVRSLVRIVAGLLYFQHGTQKLLGFPPGGDGTPETGSLLWLSGLLELVLGFLIAIGLATRPAALIAAGHMAVVYIAVHAPRDAFPVNNGGDAAILFCFIFLYLVFAGPGTWSADASRAYGYRRDPRARRRWSWRRY